MIQDDSKREKPEPKVPLASTRQEAGVARANPL